MPFHDEMIAIETEDGEREVVFRSLVGCRYCVSYESGGGRNRGHCTLLKKNVSARYASCEAFIATDVGLTDLWIRTQVRNGKLCKITYRGRDHFLSKDELTKALGYDPDEP